MDYPGMYLYGGAKDGTLAGVYAPYPKTVEQGGHNQLQMIVTARENYIARVAGPTCFPWRVMVVAENDAELLDNDMVYKISSPPTGDFSWVKPGKVAWDWWNAWNLYGVDFAAGVNTETYKYYIDFASDHGIEYVILDEGWAVNKRADLMQVVPEIDLPGILGYAAERNVGIILWAGYWAFDRDMENICRHYSDMGVKGFKVDFMDRDDQQMVDFNRRAAETGARYGLLIDLHGTHKPTGLHRTYPNVVNFEGVNGLEQMKWSPDLDQVTYDVTIPFVRQVAGPMDYTQGAMRNATAGNYRSVYSEAMSQGTRCRQLAEYVVFESPLNMLCDSPSNYMNEKECLEFIGGDSDGVGRNRGSRRRDRQVRLHGAPQRGAMVCRSHDELDSTFADPRSVVPGRREVCRRGLPGRSECLPGGPRLQKGDDRHSRRPTPEDRYGPGRRMDRKNIQGYRLIWITKSPALRRTFRL